MPTQWLHGSEVWKFLQQYANAQSREMLENHLIEYFWEQYKDGHIDDVELQHMAEELVK